MGEEDEVEDKEEGVKEEVKEEKKVVKGKGLMVVEVVATETAEQIKDSDGVVISDRELLVRVFNDVQKVKKALL